MNQIRVLDTGNKRVVQNHSTSNVYVGGANVTSSNGLVIPPGGILEVDVDSNFPLHAVAKDLLEKDLVYKILKASKEELAVYATSPSKDERELAELVLSRL